MAERQWFTILYSRMVVVIKREMRMVKADENGKRVYSNV